MELMLQQLEAMERGGAIVLKVKLSTCGIRELAVALGVVVGDA